MAALTFKANIFVAANYSTICFEKKKFRESRPKMYSEYSPSILRHSYICVILRLSHSKDPGHEYSFYAVNRRKKY